MIKKVVIMAAGNGVRMLPLTKLVPKPLIQVNRKPFLYYLLSHLNKAGYTDIAIIVGHKSELMPLFLKEYKFKATLILQKKRLGTAHALKCAKDFVGNEQFIVLGGDNLWSVKDLKKIAIDNPFNYIAASKSNEPEKYGVLIEDNGTLKKIIEKPQKFVGNLINTGLYKFSPEIFNAISQIKKSSRGEYELTDAITLLAKKDKVKVLKLKDYWLDLGKIPDIRKIGKFLDKHN